MLSFFIFLLEKAEIPEPPTQFDLFKSSFITLRGVEE
jgi:NTE family protein